MALRIGGNKQELPVEPEVPMPEEPAPDVMAELPPDLGLEEATPEGPDVFEGGSVAPEQVFYKTGQERMAQACASCDHYIAEGACHIVAGPIDPEGICNLFAGGEMLPEAAPEEEEIPMEEPAPLPEEEAPPVDEGL